MNYEERYNQALEIAKHYHDRDNIHFLEHIFPELRESEDEQHRKWILEYLYNGLRKSDEQFKDQYKSAIAWLEKQGEKTIPKNIDDAALQYVDTCAVDGEVTHGNITEPYWNNHSMMNAYKAGWLEKQGEQTFWSEEDEDIVDIAIRIIQNGGDDCAGILDSNKALRWLKSLKDRLQPQPKQEWSEEDNTRFNHLIGFIQKYGYQYFASGDKVIDWLKSLNPQNRWKPSEEQMQALFEAKLASTKNREYFLGLLYEDLKRL